MGDEARQRREAVRLPEDRADGAAAAHLRDDPLGPDVVREAEKEDAGRAVEHGSDPSASAAHGAGSERGRACGARRPVGPGAQGPEPPRAAESAPQAKRNIGPKL